MTEAQQAYKNAVEEVRSYKAKIERHGEQYHQLQRDLDAAQEREQSAKTAVLAEITRG